MSTYFQSGSVKDLINFSREGITRNDEIEFKKSSLTWQSRPAGRKWPLEEPAASFSTTQNLVLI